jgi:hypothetical protein
LVVNLIHYIFLSNCKLTGLEINIILIVFFQLTQGIVCIEIFIIGYCASGWSNFVVSGNDRRVALLTIYFFVTLQNLRIIFVILGA